MRARPLSLLLVAAIAAFGRDAAASQYPLEQATQIIPRVEGRKLQRAGIETTLDLFVEGHTGEGRRALAARSGLPIEKITSWVALADLMRVRGIGPDVARLLTAVGVRTLAELQQADAAATGTAIHDFNRKAHLSTNPPGAESIAFWIGEARRLPVVLEL
ncbi:MAG TPA: DUF4332 domain-containing protein [Polyangia bacterium]|nr:DUF4332 domain-containing protein [Polyangia bacterium]